MRCLYWKCVEWGIQEETKLVVSSDVMSLCQTEWYTSSDDKTGVNAMCR